MEIVNYKSTYFTLLLLVFALLLSLSLQAKDFNPMSVEDQVSTIKQEMIELGRDISIVEDVLLYPANLRIAVYIAEDSGNYFTIEKVKLILNEKVVQTYEYNEREKLGFVKGSAQRLYIGTLSPGKHKLIAFIEGVGPRGRHYKRGATLNFEKKSKEQTFELLIEDNEKRQKPNFVIKEIS